MGPPPPGRLESLLLGVAAGDSHSLEELYHRTRTAVYGLVLSYLKHPQDAEDVTQDAFVRIWDTAASYRPQGKPMAWVLTITRIWPSAACGSTGGRNPWFRRTGRTVWRTIPP